MPPEDAASLELPSPYQPLPSKDAIRLIEIHPADPDAPLQCTIVQTNLNEAPDYEAISYTWGDGSSPQIINLNSTSISVTRNCWSMLRRVRKRFQSRRVWVDAICINQSDIEERNAQVAIMARIYHRANHVIIDIGEESEDSEPALNFIQTFSTDYVYPIAEVRDILKAVNNLYRRPWFNRIWVLQEVFMAQNATVLCGTRYVPWAVFKPLKIWVSFRERGETEGWRNDLPNDPNPQPSPMAIGNRSERTYTAKNDFLPLLCKGRTLDATDPSDKVFALLPLLEDAAQSGLKAHYMKSPHTVFTETAAWLVENFGLSILSCVHGDSTFNGLPTWVPDWSVMVHNRWMLSLSNLFYPLAASRSAKAVMSFIDDSRELKVRGLYVDIIRTVSASLSIPTDQVWEEMNKDHVAVTQFFADFESHRQGLGRAAVSLPLPRYWRPITSSKQLHPPSWIEKYGMPFEKPQPDIETTTHIGYFCNSRQLVTTEKGYIGLASKKARVGDMVCVLLGAKTPVVLREVLEEGNWDWENERAVERRYRFLEEAYVWGLMEGEALAGLDLDKAGTEEVKEPFEDFLLC